MDEIKLLSLVLGFSTGVNILLITLVLSDIKNYHKLFKKYVGCFYKIPFDWQIGDRIELIYYDRWGNLNTQDVQIEMIHPDRKHFTVYDKKEVFRYNAFLTDNYTYTKRKFDSEAKLYSQEIIKLQNKYN
jgi:hypothetical protein